MNPLSRRVIALVLSGASAVAIATGFLQEKEGDRLTAYQDSGGVWTVCGGVTDGVKKGDRHTQAECDVMDAQAIANSDTDVERLISVPMSKPEHAAIISYCGYNLGATKCSKSSFLRDLNAGHREQACEDILHDTTINNGKTDCTQAASNCRGIPLRRQQEYQLCLMD